MRPSAAVLDAFGVRGRPELLEGGQGTTWRVDGLVLKPVADAAEHAWLCTVYAGWSAPDVDVPRPVPAPDGGWSHLGWGAHVHLPGATARVADDPAWFRSACDAFHDAVADLAVPAFLDRRQDPWSVADRLVDQRGPYPEQARGFAEACLAGVPVASGPRQVVHGDLTGNVLRRGDRPAVIDWPAYHWPREAALAVVLTDALCWHGAPVEILGDWDDVGGDHLRRALAWRVVTRALREPTADLARERATLALVERRR